MMLRFRLDYSHDALTEEQAAVMRKHVRRPELVKAGDKYFSAEGDPFAVQRECPSLKLVVDVDPLPLDGLEAILERLAQIEARLTLAGAETGQHYNERVNVHVPGLGLLLIDDVKLMKDACTDHLAEAIDAGWRILAICPQPDQRRPDYIMGRQKPSAR